MKQTEQLPEHQDREVVFGVLQQGQSRFVSASVYAMLTALVVVGLVLTLLALEIQTAARAYVTGESLWSKAQKETIYRLDRYLTSGDLHDLEEARQQLQVPLADRRARLALEQSTPDRQAAIDAFIQGQNHPADARRMVWLFIYFQHAPYFREAIGDWRATDHYILRLENIANQLDGQMASGQPDSVLMASLRRELSDITEDVRPLQDGFSASLSEGTRHLVRWLQIMAVAMIIGLALIAGTIFQWATRRIALSERKFRDTFEQAAMGMAQVSLSGDLLAVNHALCNLLGYSRQELETLSLDRLFHPDQKPATLKHLLSSAQASKNAEIRLVHRDGAPLWCRVSLSMVDQKWQGKHYLILGVEDVSQAHKLMSQLRFQAYHDPLTGAINRRGLEKQLKRSIEEARDHDSHHLLCFIDLDQFKVVNDTAGHPAGDQVLQEVTRLLRRELRQADILARLGGDEFGVILRDCDAEAAIRVAEGLRKAVEGYVFTSGEFALRLGASVGCVSINRDSPGPSELLRTADTACYMAKEYGRNRVVHYSPDDRDIQVRESEMASLSHIRHALAGNRFVLLGQEIRPVQSNGKSRCEVLLRMLDDAGREISPAKFLPAAERFHVAPDIDRWVVQNTLDTLARHARELAQLEACHINLSGQSIGREDFLKFLEAAIDESSIDPTKLCFEITETAAISNLADARHLFRRLRQKGCQFALDDFGSGLSSFGYLTSMPVDIIKIDGAFVCDAVDNELHRAIVRSIGEIVSVMGKRAAAEFVETDAVGTLMAELGIDFLQGYAIHRPCSLADLLGQLDAQQKQQSRA
ncbi:MAG: EAL domain-containing protein [Natronospirillum sp.]|uniref:putative bifunctional diguanylate cyclase/phosphodiesterase n=1 Tax=Natronospirillum sp. TaxID=2812955 RepID=UPI0025E94103|nr:EAL domain-containing protein [Natronospirillum sp.]MCH8552217.1 EAL domain-containing protein [Natronospirillum sp.]